MGAHHRAKAVIALPLPEAQLSRLAECDLTMLPEGRADDGAFTAALAETEGLLVSSHVRVDRATMESAPKLRVISTMSVGVDHIDLDAARDRGIVVAITPVLSDAVADLAMALVTMLSRHIPEGMRAVADGHWGGVPLGQDLAGAKLLIVGFGRIGQAMASRALAAKMCVRCVDTRSELPVIAGVDRVEGLDEGLRWADVVSLHVDLRADTWNLMGEKEFSVMKQTAFLVNTSRGGIVDQVALARALTAGDIAGAGLDVLREEPPQADDPVLGAPNLIVVPHQGSATRETRHAMAQRAVDNLLAGLRGEGIASATP